MGQDVEGSGGGLIELISPHMPEKNHEKLRTVGVPAGIQIWYILKHKAEALPVEPAWPVTFLVCGQPTEDFRIT
jgi:hypothetical protein